MGRTPRIVHDSGGSCRWRLAMRTFLAMAAAAALVAGCARSYEPIVDTKGIDEARYQQDLSECRDYAEQVNVGGEAAVGTGIGAALGAAIGAIAGAFGANAGKGAALGAGL